MLKTSALSIAGRRTNVEFAIDDDAPFELVTSELREYLSENRALCSAGTITVNVGRRMLHREQLGELKQILEMESGLTVAKFWCAPGILESALSEDVGLPVAVAPVKPPDDRKNESNGAKGEGVEPVGEEARQWLDAAAPAWPRGNDALIVKTICRSGEIVRHFGDVIVLGDVNPGAEIIADGDIVVFGCLRGLAHAGAWSDHTAAIVALRLDAPRLKIGPHTGTAPKATQRQKSTRTGPKIAYVRRQSIYVSSFTGRFAGYGRGTLYDG